MYVAEGAGLAAWAGTAVVSGTSTLDVSGGSSAGMGDCAD